MKVFNAKNAAEDYMSTHTLTYSTPEMTLLKFAKWLGDIVEIQCKLDKDKCPNEDGLHPKHKVPRLMLYIEEKEEYKMDISEEFIPTGAVTTLFARIKDYAIKGKESSADSNESKSRSTFKFCIACGAKIDSDASFCIECGAKQE